MPHAPRPALVVLWLYVVTAGLLAGGSVFEHSVLTPIWAGAPPDSVRAWPYGGVQSAFFAVVSPIYGLCALALAALARRLAPAQRRPALVAGVCGVIVVVATIAFFLPILGQTEVNRGAGLSDGEIVALVGRFRTWNWGRLALLVGGWLAGLRAFSRSGEFAAARDVVARP